MSNTKGLIPFTSETAPRKGRPLRAKNYKKIIKNALELIIEGTNPATGEKERLTAQEVIVLKQTAKAMQGNLKSAEWLFNRIYGKPVETTKLETANKKVNEKEMDSRINSLLKLRALDVDAEKVE